MQHSYVCKISSDEIAIGWSCLQTLEELAVSKVLAEASFTDEQIKLPATQIVNRSEIGFYSFLLSFERMPEGRHGIRVKSTLV